MSNGSRLTLNATTVDDNVAQGTFAVGAGSLVTVNGGSIANTRRDSQGRGCYAVNAQDGANVVCAGAALSGNAAGNVFVAGEGAIVGCN